MSTDTTRSKLVAFVVRRMGPEAVENMDLRRMRGHVNVVAVAKGVWARVFKNDNRTDNADISLLRLASIGNAYVGVRTQLMNPISVPACEVNTAAEGWDVGLLPGAFPSDETLHNTVDYSHGVCLQATNIPLPLQSVREIQQLEAEPVSIVPPPNTTTVTTIQRSLSLFPPTPSMRAFSPDWVLPPINSRRSLDSTAIESRPEHALCFNANHELEKSIDQFQFSILVKSTIIDHVKDIWAMVNMTSSNLLNIGWDLMRLLVIWRNITLNASDVDVLRLLQPWTRISKEHIAKACGLMQKGLQSYRDWFDIMDHASTIAKSRNAMNCEWWAIHDERLKELDVLHKMDFNDVAAQVQLVMEKCLGFDKEVANLHKPVRNERMTNATCPTSAKAAISRKSPSTDRSSLPTPVLQPKRRSLIPRPVTRYPKIQQASSSPEASVKDGKRPTKVSLQGSEPTASVPIYARPTKATRGAYTPLNQDGRPVTSAPRSQAFSGHARLDHTPPINISTRLPLKVGSTHPPKYRPINGRSDAHGTDRAKKPCEELFREPTTPPVEAEDAIHVEVSFIHKSDTLVTAKRFSDLRAKMIEMRKTLVAMNLKRGSAVSGVGAELIAENELPVTAVNDEAETTENFEQPLVAINEVAEATKDDNDEPSTAVRGRAEEKEDEATDDDYDDNDDNDEDVWYDASEFPVEGKCP